MPRLGEPIIAAISGETLISVMPNSCKSKRAISTKPKVDFTTCVANFMRERIFVHPVKVSVVQGS